MIFGARTSLAVGFGTAALSITAGTLVGLIAGYAGSWTDHVIMRIADVFSAFPFLIGLLALISVVDVPKGPEVIILVIAVFAMWSSSRIVRAMVLSLRERDYVTAARAVGGSAPRILLRHILPNTFAPIIVLASVSIGAFIVAEAGLSFLGFGIPPPTPSWGNLLSGDTRELMDRAPWLMAAPGIALTLTVLSFNLFGDALRDIMDPRLRGA